MDWEATNRRYWDERARLHAEGGFYDVGGLIAGQDPLRAFEPGELGDVDGLDLVHLQCHIGTDTLGWARRGARVRGLDFSAEAVAAARELFDRAGQPGTFHEADVMDAVAALGAGSTDVVYTGLGALCWLRDLAGWAGVVHDLLRPGGRLYLVEFNPLVNDCFADDEPVPELDYFDDAPRVFEAAGSYAGPADTTANRTVETVKRFGEVVTALIRAGLVLDHLAEHDFTVYPRWPGLIRNERGEYRFPDGPSLPQLYSLRARKP